jgi:hypothetical protein
MITKKLVHKNSSETTASTSINRKNLFIMKNMQIFELGLD